MSTLPLSTPMMLGTESSLGVLSPGLVLLHRGSSEVGAQWFWRLLEEGSIPDTQLTLRRH